MLISIRTLLLAGAAVAAAAPAYAGHPALQEAATRRSPPAPTRTVSRPSAAPVRSTSARQPGLVAAPAGEPAAHVGFAPPAGSGCTNCGPGGGNFGQAAQSDGYSAAGYNGSNGPSMRTTYSGHNPPTPWDRLKFKYNNYWKPGLQESHWGYPELFGEKPLGYYPYQHARTQVANAEAVRMTLYEYDFDQEKETLSARGEVQLEKIAMLAGKNFFPIVLTPTPNDPGLADRRREKLLQVLEASNFPIPPERIVVARPLTPGTYDYEPETILRVQNDGSIGGRMGAVINNGGVNGASQLLSPSITGAQ